jgi:serine-type D-Ala-D-Ala carboxypeptidase/endopeptidase
MERRSLPRWLALCALLLGVLALPVTLAETPALSGDYLGTLGPLHLKLHLAVGADGKLSGTLDSIDQGALGIPCSDFQARGGSLSFAVPAVHGTWRGTVSADGRTLSGTWNQGSDMPLAFSRDTFVAAATPSAVDGVWLGTLEAPRQSLRIQVTLRSDRDGREYCLLDSPDQSAWHIDCANVSWSGTELAFEVPAVRGRWSGQLSADGRELSGTWTQGTPLPLRLVRQVQAIEPPPPLKTTMAPAIAPVDAAHMQAVLERDFAAALKDGRLAPQTHAGVTIGIVHNGVRRVFAWGIARPDSIFEIGSITKTFTGLVLAQMVLQGKVKLEEPVRELLPSGTVARPQGAEITLLDLITQHSGLPRLPDNLAPADPKNPYADYHAADLYRFLASHGVARPADAAFLYSNLGVGLLGQALANRAGLSFAQLVAEEVTRPLDLVDTVITLSSAQQARFIEGHSADGKPAGGWDFDALAGAGSLRSTAADMLSYLEANLHPEAKAKDAAGAARTLGAALALSHELRAEAGPERIACAWFYDAKRGEYQHDGGTGGYSSYALFNPQADYAAVVLLNRTVDTAGSLADLLGRHISQRFAGEPAVTFGD